MKKVLFVSNPIAGTVSSRVKQVIVKALEADFKLEVAETAGRNHAGGFASDAVDRDFDAVFVFGGDGTINETAQGLVGSDVPLGVFPGGSTNVMARALGVPRDPVEATAFAASHLKSGTRRLVNAGKLNDRFFMFNAGMGLDAEVVRRVESDPENKRRNHEGLFVRNAFKAGLTEYRGSVPLISLAVDGNAPVDVITAICCKGAPFTYYKHRPVDVCPSARLDKGLDVFGLGRLRARMVPRLVYSLFVSRSHPRWNSSSYHHDISRVRLRAEQPMPVQVDGDYIGQLDSADIDLVPDALHLLV
ncbi:MAG: diacylglycerol/lipid kinase family protein [Actinomycetota bacterium]